MTITERRANGARRRTLPLTATSMPSNRMSGFRSGWLSGDDAGGLSFTLDSGAGLGNPMLTLTVKRGDKTIAIETANISPLVEEWVRAVVQDEEDGTLVGWQQQPKAEDFPEGWR